MHFLKIKDLNGANLDINLSVVLQTTEPKTIAAQLPDLAVDEYESEALVPLSDWRPLTRSMNSQFTTDEVRAPNEELFFFKLDRFDFQYIKRFASAFGGNSAFTSAKKRFEKILKKYVTLETNTEILGVFSSGANLYTVTRNKNKKLIGLHVDNWDSKPIGDRHSSRSRICINLGPGVRYFFYCPIDFIREYEATGSDLGEFRRATVLGRRFLREQSECPILRLRLQPGCAYVAPTEYIIHDGSTYEAQCGSDTLVVFGRFSPAC